MPKDIMLQLTVKEYASFTELPTEDQELIKAAQLVTGHAYAPYSNFWVGAAIRLKSGVIITATNQENAAYPSGLCAERAAIYWAGSNYPEETIDTIAVAARQAHAKEYIPVTPCGACRQALSEYENRQTSSIRMLMEAPGGKFHEIPSIDTLLPFKFSVSSLKEGRK